MDYHSIHGHDIASFEISSSPHRLPTVTASAALEDLKGEKSQHVSTGLVKLDSFLHDGTSIASQSSPTGGLKYGQVTEIWGPPGSGKTALGLQMTAIERCNGRSVVWIDCFQDVPPDRLTRVCDAVKQLQGQRAEETQRTGDQVASFYHYGCLTLPHLVALTSRPVSRLVPDGTSLIVIDSLTALINSWLPRPQDGKQGPDTKRGPNASLKRRQALQSIMKSLQTLASVKNCAVALLSQCATKMQLERGASLTPAINANLWEQGVSTRLVLFKDWDWVNGKSKTVHLAGIQKLDGKNTNSAFELVSAFTIKDTGIASATYNAAPHPSAGASNVMQSKRKLAQTDFEVPDSEDDEDYGWAQDDEAAMPPPPQQWQGSEDILLGQEVGLSEDEDEAGNEEDKQSGHGD